MVHANKLEDTSFSHARYIFSALDRATGKLWTKTTSNKKSVIDLLAQYKLDNPYLCRIRCDEEFNTDAVKAWASKREIRILPKVPHELDLTQS